MIPLKCQNWEYSPYRLICRLHQPCKPPLQASNLRNFKVDAKCRSLLTLSTAKNKNKKGDNWWFILTGRLPFPRLNQWIFTIHDLFKLAKPPFRSYNWRSVILKLKCKTYQPDKVKIWEFLPPRPTCRFGRSLSLLINCWARPFNQYNFWNCIILPSQTYTTNNLYCR